MPRLGRCLILLSASPLGADLGTSDQALHSVADFLAQLDDWANTALRATFDCTDLEELLRHTGPPPTPPRFNNEAISTSDAGGIGRDLRLGFARVGGGIGAGIRHFVTAAEGRAHAGNGEAERTSGAEQIEVLAELADFLRITYPALRI